MNFKHWLESEQLGQPRPNILSPEEGDELDFQKKQDEEERAIRLATLNQLASLNLSPEVKRQKALELKKYYDRLDRARANTRAAEMAKFKQPEEKPSLFSKIKSFFK
jgi:hypothetical protein